MLVTGVALTLVSTWGAGFASARLRDSDDSSQRDTGRLVPIPFAGPIILATGGGTRGLFSVLAMAQGGGLAFTALGAINVSRHRRLGHDLGFRRVGRDTGVLALTQGVVWLGVSWGMTFGFSGNRGRRDAFARRLQAPIIGGIWAAPRAPDYTRGYLGLTSSAIQIASASAIVFGAIVLSKQRKRNTLTVLPVPTAEGGQLVAAMRF